MTDFTLIQGLNDENQDNPTIPNGISYQQYEIDVEKETLTVNIPLREAANFEKSIAELDSNLTKKILKKILREFRGIRG